MPVRGRERRFLQTVYDALRCATGGDFRQNGHVRIADLRAEPYAPADDVAAYLQRKKDFAFPEHRGTGRIEFDPEKQQVSYKLKASH